MHFAASLVFLGSLTWLAPAGAAQRHEGAHAGLPPHEPIEVVVSGPHDRALAHWIRAAEEGRLVRGETTVVHFDAHPDMELPIHSFPPGWPAAPEQVLEAVSIGSFLLGAFRIHLVERAVWLRPSWARQLPDGERRFWLGETEDRKLRVTDESDYYVLQGGWAPLAALGDDRVPVQVRVLSLDDAAREAPIASVGSVVLDIDLDGFGTRNPGADRLRAVGLREIDVVRLREMFAPAGLGLAADPATRYGELEELNASLESVASLRWSALPRALLVLRRRGLGVGDLFSLFRILQHLDPDVPLAALLEDGSQAVASPEHPADPREIQRSALALGQLLASGSVRPRLVTIARSVEDGFTPPSDWPFIEWTVLDALRDALGDYRLRYDEGIQAAPRPASR